MLIAEELYLLLTKDSGTQEQAGAQRGYGLSAALVVDLVMAGRVGITQERSPRMHVVNPAPTGHPVLDRGLALLVHKDGKKLDGLITSTKLDPTDSVVASLVNQGVLAIGGRTMLGLGKPRTPEVNPGPELDIRQRLAAVLAGRILPSAADATLLAILQGLGVAKKILDAESGGLRAKDLKARIEAVSQSSPAGDAVQRAVQSINAAILAAVIVPAIVAGGVSG